MTNLTPDALLPCPFCGGGNWGYVLHGVRVTITCDDCHAEGPRAFSEAGAIAQWNRRAGQSHDAGLLAALEFYADPEMWTPHKDANSPIEMDDGKIARAAICERNAA